MATQLLCGIYEHALAYGVREMVTVYDVRIARLLRSCGCEVSWQSKPQAVGNTKAVAASFPMSWDILARIRAVGGVTQSVVRHAPWRFEAFAAE